MHTGMDKEAARGIVRSMALQSAGPDLNSSSAEPGARVRRVRHPPQARNLKGRLKGTPANSVLEINMTVLF